MGGGGVKPFSSFFNGGGGVIPFLTSLRKGGGVNPFWCFGDDFLKLFSLFLDIFFSPF